MRKLVILGLLLLLLSGCKAQEAYETMLDTLQELEQAVPMEIMVNLPEEAAKQAMSSEDSGSVYFCEDYVLTVQTLPGGDLRKTVLETTGYEMEQLSMIETVQGDAKRYVCVWSCVGENGDQVGRCALLDDGNYHYVLTAVADEEKAGRLTEDVWDDVFRSFRLIAPEDKVSSGS